MRSRVESELEMAAGEIESLTKKIELGASLSRCVFPTNKRRSRNIPGEAHEERNSCKPAQIRWPGSSTRISVQSGQR